MAEPGPPADEPFSVEAFVRLLVRAGHTPADELLDVVVRSGLDRAAYYTLWHERIS